MIRPLVVALALALSATAAWADRYSDCSRRNKNIGPDRVIRSCTQVIERGKRESRENRAIAYFNRGLTYNYKGDYDRAIADYTKAIKLNPKYASAYYERGVAYNKKRAFDRAIADYDKAIALDPNDALAYTGRGTAYADTGDVDRAFADYDKAIKLDPKLATAYFNRGLTYGLLDEYDLAIADLTKAVALDASLQEAKDAIETVGRLRVQRQELDAILGK